MKFNKFLYISFIVAVFGCLIYWTFLSAETINEYQIEKMDNNAVVFLINDEIFIYAEDHLYIATQWHHAADCPHYSHDYE